MATYGTLTVDRIEIYNSDSVRPIKMKFTKGVNVIQGEGSEQALEIIESLISGRTFAADCGFGIWCTAGGEKFLIEAGKDSPLSSLTSVEQRLCVFDAQSKYDWSREFYNYLNEDEIYPYNTLAKQTCGISSTQSFRVYFNRYINRLTASGALNQDGIFRRPSGVSQAQFNFNCFANVLDFWDGFNEIRNLNHIRLPVIVFGRDINLNTIKNRQVILINY